MFEIGIFCVILFAVVYWALLFIMGRRGDVLHGEFVEAEPEPGLTATAAPMPFPTPVAPPVAVVEQNVAPPPLPNPPAANAETLQSLLVSLKQELKNAAKI